MSEVDVNQIIRERISYHILFNLIYLFNYLSPFIVFMGSNPHGHNSFYEFQKVEEASDRSNNRGKWRRYVCSICKAKLYSRELLVEHKQSSHAY